MTSKAPNAEKGARYLKQLDQALCSGQWGEIAELARKVDKHAPERKCLTAAARIEATLSKSSNDQATLNISAVELREAIAAADTGKRYPEDVYAAKICLAEVSSLQGQGSEAVLGLLDNASGGSGGSLAWTRVCDAKAAYLRAEAFETQGGRGEDLNNLYAWTASRGPTSTSKPSPEESRWTSKLSRRACMSTYKSIERGPTDARQLSKALRHFQTWSGSAGRSGESSSSQRPVWKAYYELLSTLLEEGFFYNPSANSPPDLLLHPSQDDELSDSQHTVSKQRQTKQLKHVEGQYESILLASTQFPKANQTNTEVESFVERVIGNWTILNSPSWSSSSANRASLGSGVLELLYRAATKTFHSTLILRHLFSVHAALYEFDLAMHAFDTYIELVSRAKARASKTGDEGVVEDGPRKLEHEDPQAADDSDTAILTAARGVRVLCTYGDGVAASDRAMKIGKIVQSWLPQSTEQTNGDNSTDPVQITVRPKTLAVGYGAIGTAQAHFSRRTCHTDTRAGLREEALKNLRKAQKYDPRHAETSYELALLLVESKDVSGAIHILKRALAASDDADEDDTAGREQSTVELLHLLALCLSARDEYESAAKVCEAALDQFGDEDIAIDEVSDLDKASILDAKMTRLSLLELVEGHETAVERSYELLADYAKLYGTPEMTKPGTKPPTTATTAASSSPSKHKGTLRSIAGSIRPKSTRNSVEKDTFRQAPSAVSVRDSTIPESTANGDTAIGAPIAITVTNEHGVSAEKEKHHHFPFKLRGGHSRSVDNVGDIKPPQAAPTSNAPGAAEKTVNAEQPLKEIPHSTPHDQLPPPPGHQDQPPRQDTRLPTSEGQRQPNSPQGARSEAALIRRKQQISVLVKIWLFIAGLYLRADLLPDSQEAVDEAQRLIEAYGREAGANEQSSARKLFEKGWHLPSTKSVDESWGDAYAAKATLASSHSRPHEALAFYEQALAYWPDHSDAIIGLSEILMDIFEQKLPAEEPKPSINPTPPPTPLMLRWNPETTDETSSGSAKKAFSSNPSTAEINRLACLSRAQMLLTTLTQFGSGNRTGASRPLALPGCDDSSAWMALARAHELSGQIEKAKECLWWVVEIEDWGIVR